MVMPVRRNSQKRKERARRPVDEARRSTRGALTRLYVPSALIDMARQFPAAEGQSDSQLGAALILMALTSGGTRAGTVQTD